MDLIDSEGRPFEREPMAIHWDPISAEKGGYDRFMAEGNLRATQGRGGHDRNPSRRGGLRRSIWMGINISPELAERITRIHLVALWDRLLLVHGREVSLRADCRNPDRSRSRERVSLPKARSRWTIACWFPYRSPGRPRIRWRPCARGGGAGAHVISICNTRESTIARESDDVLYTHAGPEIGVASTKAFTTQIVAHYLLALKLGIARGLLDREQARERLQDLIRLPRLIENTLELDDGIRQIAQKYFHSTNFLFLGRGIMYPIALEGALKLKEISYIHAEGYAAGEMKHGPIALIDEDMPVVVIANRGFLYEKVISNLEQVRSREGAVIAIATEGDEEIAEKANDVIYIPDLGEYLTSVIAVVPLQLLAYHIAVLKGTDVDQPRNLAKSVTVE